MWRSLAGLVLRAKLELTSNMLAQCKVGLVLLTKLAQSTR